MSISGKMSVGMRRMATTPDDEDQNGGDDERVRAAQGESDDPHGRLLPGGHEGPALPADRVAEVYRGQKGYLQPFIDYR